MSKNTQQESTRTVIITGATRGIGREMAKGFSRRGWRVAGCARSRKDVEKIAEDLGAGNFFEVVDISNDASVATFARQVIDNLGTPDLLINNAALMNDPARLWEIPAVEFDRLTAVNINGIANVIRHFAGDMIRQGRGIIVNLSSGWGRSTSADVAPYCTSKWAVEGLTSALAQELPEGMAAISLNPGVIDTDMLRQCWGNEAASCQTPAQWAKTALPFLEKITAQDNGRQLTAP
ncbi:MAG: SDR family oxidoreductase [Verrucomicrobiaceae bacterium]|nr:SDR family oxidoreductase [Verrucomicrobiaceae bacterium]